jgi:hypothetical protein
MIIEDKEIAKDRRVRSLRMYRMTWIDAGGKSRR